MMCETFENIVEFLKNTLPDMTKPQMEKIITQVTIILICQFRISQFGFLDQLPEVADW